MKKLLVIVALLFSAETAAQDSIPATTTTTIIERAPTSNSASSLNLNMPNSPQSFQQDRVRAGDFECSAAIGSATNLEFGVVGILNQDDPYYGTYYGTDIGPPTRFGNQAFTRDVGVYARINIPIGAPKERPNCNLLYKLELEKKRLEVLRLQQELQNLRNLQFEE